MSEVAVIEPITTKVGKLLIEKGFSLVSCIDKPGCPLAPTHSFGLLNQDVEAKSKKHFLCFIKRREPPKHFFGILWFNNPMFGANESNWIFEVHERKDIGLAEQLTKELTSAFNVKIALVLG